jgi:cation diffusion facilitator CzcD-associated flavoprotein CzcO
VPSHLYSFSFAPNPNWSRTYSPQAEIWEYLRSCVDRFGLRSSIRFNHEVVDAAWDVDEGRWVLETTSGRWTADFVVSANGGLSEPAIPHIPGLEDFQGTYFHSATWDHSHDLTGRKVAVVGTGASAIQFIPHIQPAVDRLHVFQRTPAWILPHTDRPTTERERRLYRRFPIVQKMVRTAIYMARELLVFGLAKNTKLLRPLEQLGRRHLRAQVPDRELRKKLRPNFSPGCKRLLLSNDYLPAMAKKNVEVVTEGIAEIRPGSVVSSDGSEREVDTIIFATGFKVTDNPVKDRLRGREGHSLGKTWMETGLRAYLGTTVPGFPNLFMLSGPNTGIGHTSLLVMIEAQIRYVGECLKTMRERGLDIVEVREDATERFNDELQMKMGRTVWNSGGCQSWYLDELGRNTTLWPDFTWRFKLRTRRFEAADYFMTRRDNRIESDATG